MEQDDYEEFKDNPKFKQFIDDFKAQLALFDRAKEWADLIKCLQRIQKVLDKYQQIPIVPDKLTFSKRVAQCCSPALPSGVHLKSLEVLGAISTRLGATRLSRDLALWLPGPLSLFPWASSQVKIAVLGWVKSHVIPLGAHVITSLEGLVMSLLPGLEDVNAECYKPVMEIFSELLNACGPIRGHLRQFNTAVWKSLLLNPTARIASLHYLYDKMPKLSRDDDDRHVLEEWCPERDTLVLNALIAGISDSNLLVQRTALDLILTRFQVHHHIFSLEQWSLLIAKTLRVQLRKEVSLNRRIYQWLTGRDKDNNPIVVEHDDYLFDAQVTYFARFAKAPLLLALQRSFEEPFSDSKHVTDTFKMLTTLLERVEIGQEIINHVLYWPLLVLHTYKEGYAFTSEVISLVNALLADLKPQLLWDFLTASLHQSFTQLHTDETHVSFIEIVDTLLEKMLQLNSAEVQMHHLPRLLSTLLNGLQLIVEHATRDNAPLHHLNETGLMAVQLALKISGKLHFDDSEQSGAQLDELRRAVTLYHHAYVMVIDQLLLPIWRAENARAREKIDHVTQQHVQRLKRQKMRQGGLESLDTTGTTVVNTVGQVWSLTPAVYTLDLASQLLLSLHAQFKLEVPAVASGAASVPEWVRVLIRLVSDDNPLVIAIAVKTFVSLLTLPANGSLTTHVIHHVLHTTKSARDMAHRLWEHSFAPQHQWQMSVIHYKAAALMIELHHLAPEACEDVIAESLLAAASPELKVAHMQRFALLWRLTGEVPQASHINLGRTLFLMLDALHDEGPLVRLAGRTWLAESLQRAERVLDPLLLVLLDSSTAMSALTYQYQHVYDHRRILYVFKVLRAIIECDFRTFVSQTSAKPVSRDLVDKYDRQLVQTSGTVPGAVTPRTGAVDVLHAPPANYLELLVVMALRFIAGQPPVKAPSEFITRNVDVQTTSAGFLQYLLLKITVPAKARQLAHMIQDHVISCLAQAVSESSLILQVQLLQLLRTCVLIDSLYPAVKAVSPTSADGKSRDGEENSLAASPMFLQTLLVGLLQPSTNYNIRFYWLEFVTSTVTYLASQPKTQPLLVEIVPPLIGCMCTMAHSYLSFDVTPGSNNSNLAAWSSCYDSLVSKDLLMILQSLSYVLAMLLIPESTATTVTATNNSTAAQNSRLRSFSTFFKDIFQTSDLPPEVTPPPPPPPGSSDIVRDALLRELPAVMSLLIRIWGPPSLKTSKSNTSAQSRRKSSVSSPNASDRGIKLPVDVQQDETHNKYMLQDQILQIVEPIFITYPSHVLKSLLKYWKVTPSRDMEESVVSSQSTSEATVTKKIIVELLTTLLATPASVDALYKAATQLLHQLHVITHQQHVTATNTNTNTAPSAASKSVPTSTSQVSGRVIDIEDKDIVLVDLLAALTLNRASQLTALELLDLFVPFLKQVVYTRSPYAFIHALHMLHLYVQACASSLSSPKTDKKKLKALGDVTQKMIEGCLYFACQSFGALVGDLNNEIVLGNVLSPQSLAISVDHSAESLTSSASSFVVVESDELKRTAKDSVNRTQISLSSLRALLKSMNPLLDKVFYDKDRVTQITSLVLQNIWPYVKGRLTQPGQFMTPLHKEISVKLIESWLTLPNSIKTWKKDVLDYFYALNIGAAESSGASPSSSAQQDFFTCSVKTLHNWMPIIAHIMADKNTFADLLKSLARVLSVQGLQEMIKTRHEERAKLMKRLAFVIYAAAPETYLEQLPLIQERVVDALRLKENTALLNHVLLTLRVLLLRCNFKSLSSFWPVVITELIRVFTTQENDAVLSAAKFVDLASILSCEDFNVHKWMFVSDGLQQGELFKAHFVPFIDRIAPPDNNHMPYKPTSRRPLINVRSLASNEHVTTENASPKMEYKALLSFLSQFGNLSFRNVVSSRTIDWDYVHHVILTDFTEETSDANSNSEPALNINNTPADLSPSPFVPSDFK